MGALTSVGAAFIWASTFCCYKRVGENLSAYTLNLFKNFVAFFAFLIAVCLMRPEAPVHADSWMYLTLSGVLGIAVGDLFLLESLKCLGTRSASILFCLSPLFAIGAGYLCLGETMSPGEIAGITITLVSVIAVLYLDQPGEATDAEAKKNLRRGIIFGIISAGANGIGMVLARKGFMGTDALLGATIRTGPAMIALMIVGLYGRRTQKSFDDLLDSKHLGVLAITVFMGGFVGIILASFGTKFLKAGLAATLTSSVPIWTFLIERFLFRQKTKPIAVPFVFSTLLGIYFIFS
jgi:drug/metabolite transporter (DMT)-like permease